MKHAADLHFNGVHLECRLPSKKWTGLKYISIGDGTHRSCVLAGSVEQHHSHDYDGPLVCGCPEER